MLLYQKQNDVPALCTCVPLCTRLCERMLVLACVCVFVGWCGLVGGCACVLICVLVRLCVCELVSV